MHIWFFLISSFIIWTNLIPLHPRRLCAKVCWNWPSSYGEEEFKNVVNVYLLFWFYLLFEMSMVLNLNKLESLSLKASLCQNWIHLTTISAEEFFFHFVNLFLLICNYLLSEKGVDLYLNKLESSSSMDDICAKFDWNWSSGCAEDFL